jgi:hypothetical protein
MLSQKKESIFSEIKKSIDDEKKSTERTLSEQIDYEYELLTRVVHYLDTTKDIPPEEEKDLNAIVNELFDHLKKWCRVKTPEELQDFMQNKFRYGLVDPEYIPGEAPGNIWLNDKVDLNTLYFMEEKPSIDILNKNIGKYSKSYLFVKEPPGLFYIDSVYDEKTQESQAKLMPLIIKDVSAYKELLVKAQVNDKKEVKLNDEKPFIKKFMDIIQQNPGHTLKGRYNLKRAAKNVVLLRRNKLMVVNKESKELDKKHQTKMYAAQERASSRVTIREGKFYNNTGNLMDTSTMISHDKPGYAAFVINDHGEITMFKHHRMRQHDEKKNPVDVVAHSAWNSGRSVIGAGEIKIKNGTLIGLTDHSGHYKPNYYNIYEALLIFKKAGVDVSKVSIQVVYRDARNQSKKAKVSANSVLEMHDRYADEHALFKNVIRTGEHKIKFVEQQLSMLGEIPDIRLKKVRDDIENCKTCFSVVQDTGLAYVHRVGESQRFNKLIRLTRKTIEEIKKDLFSNYIQRIQSQLDYVLTSGKKQEGFKLVDSSVNSIKKIYNEEKLTLEDRIQKIEEILKSSVVPDVVHNKLSKIKILLEAKEQITALANEENKADAIYEKFSSSLDVLKETKHLSNKAKIITFFGGTSQSETEIFMTKLAQDFARDFKQVREAKNDNILLRKKSS